MFRFRYSLIFFLLFLVRTSPVLHMRIDVCVPVNGFLVRGEKAGGDSIVEDVIAGDIVRPLKVVSDLFRRSAVSYHVDNEEGSVVDLGGIQ